MLPSSSFEKLAYSRRRWFDLLILTASLLIVFTFLISAFSGEKIVSIPVDGKWKIIRQDDIAFAEKDFDDSAWPEISLPNKYLMPLETPNVPRNTQFYGPLVSDHKGYVWYRKKIDINHLPYDHLILQIAR